MEIAAARPRVGVEAKATSRSLDKLRREMEDCRGMTHGEHRKCLGLEVFRPRLFLGVAAHEDWRLFPVEQSAGRVVWEKQLPDPDLLYFDAVL
jgi:hypothetical protein